MIDKDKIILDLEHYSELQGFPFRILFLNILELIRKQECRHRLIPLVIDPMTNGYHCIDCGRDFEAYVHTNGKTPWASIANKKLEDELVPNSPTVQDIKKTSSGFWDTYDKVIDVLKGKV